MQPMATAAAPAQLVPMPVSPMVSVRPRPQSSTHSVFPGWAPAPLPLAQTALTWVGHMPGMHPSVMSATVTSVPVGHGTPRVVGGNRGGTDSERRRISVDRRRHCRKWGWESQSQWREHLQLQPTCSAGLPVPHPTPLQGTSQWPARAE